MHQGLTFIKKFWPLLLILTVALISRLYKIDELFYFTYDESVPAFVGRRLILFHHIPLIGGVTPFGVHITPYFYWFLASLLYVGKLNPITWGYAAAVISTFTVFLVYKLGILIGDKKFAFTATTMLATSYLVNLYDRRLWALFWGPLLSIIFIYSLIKILDGQKNYFFVIAAASILALSTDPSNLVFLALSIVTFILFKTKFEKKILVAIVLVTVSICPLIIFDLKHDFQNSKPFFSFWQKGHNNPGLNEHKLADNSLLFPRTFIRVIYPLTDNQIVKNYSYCKTYVEQKYKNIPFVFILISSAILLGSLYYSIKSKNKGWKIISILMVIYFIGIQIYGSVFKADIFEHYITGLFVPFLLISAKIISIMPKKIWLLAVCLFIFINLQKLSSAKNWHGLFYKNQAVNYVINETENSRYSIESLSTCWRLSGYRYLLAITKKPPVKSYVDPNLGYLYEDQKVDLVHPDTVAAFVTHDFVSETENFYQTYAKYKSHEIQGSIFGNIEVLIMDNKSGWFR